MSEALDELTVEVIKELLKAGDIESACDLAIMRMISNEEVKEEQNNARL